MSKPVYERAQESGGEPIEEQLDEPRIGPAVAGPSVITPPPHPTATPLPPATGRTWPPPPPPVGQGRPSRSLELPPWTPPLAAAVVTVAAMADQAARVPFASLATTLLVVALAALLVVAGRTTSLAQRSGLVVLVASGAVLSIRDSDWVSAVIALSIGALVALVASDGLVLGQHRPWSRSFFDWMGALFDVGPWLRDAVKRVGAQSSGRFAVGIRAAMVGSAVTLVLGSLLASGDAAFGWLVSVFNLPSWLGHLLITAVMVIPAAIVALVAARAEPKTFDASLQSTQQSTLQPAGRRSFRVEALTAVWAVAGTLLVWCVLQVVLISGGARSVVLAERGLTAADYAREGFFQLVTVAAISLAVFNTAHRIGRTNLTPDRAQRLPVVVIGATLSVLIVVSFSRLGYYIGSFGLTMLRLSVATFLAWLAVMTAASVARSLGLHRERNWLPSAAVLSASLFAIGFGIANPERWVAQVNLDRSTIEQPVDARYLLADLGADAIPTIAEYRWSRLGGRPEAVTRALCSVAEERGGSSPLGWNRSRSYEPEVPCPDD